MSDQVLVEDIRRILNDEREAETVEALRTVAELRQRVADLEQLMERMRRKMHREGWMV